MLSLKLLVCDLSAHYEQYRQHPENQEMRGINA